MSLESDYADHLVLMAEAEQINPPILEHAQRFAAAAAAVGVTVPIKVLADRRHQNALDLMANPSDPTLLRIVDYIEKGP